jgi:hypothetical protein
VLLLRPDSKSASSHPISILSAIQRESHLHCYCQCATLLSSSWPRTSATSNQLTQAPPPIPVCDIRGEVPGWRGISPNQPNRIRPPVCTNNSPATIRSKKYLTALHGPWSSTVFPLSSINAIRRRLKEKIGRKSKVSEMIFAPSSRHIYRRVRSAMNLAAIRDRIRYPPNIRLNPL